MFILPELVSEQAVMSESFPCSPISQFASPIVRHKVASMTANAEKCEKSSLEVVELVKGLMDGDNLSEAWLYIF